MNTALPATLLIPLLLVLACFNANAHGLTTFGKSQSNQQNVPLPPSATTKPCQNQLNCTLIKNTTCMGGHCKCGDNQFPINGLCKSQFQGPNHICNKNDDCVDNADCIPVRELPATEVDTAIFTNDMSLCKCQEGYETYPGTCGGTRNYAAVSLIFAWIAAYLLTQ